MSRIVEKINALSSSVESLEFSESALEVAKSICELTENILLADDLEVEKLSEFEESIRQLLCDKIVGFHSWQFDQCGYWGHQYCAVCLVSRYPDLASMRCSDAYKKTENATEEQWLERLKNMDKAYVLTIAQVDQIQAGLQLKDPESERKAIDFIEELMSLETGKYMILEGYKAVVMAMAKAEE